MHRICAAVCETARLAHWRRNLASNPLVSRKQDTLFRRAFFDRFGLQTASLWPERDRGFESRSLQQRVICELDFLHHGLASSPVLSCHEPWNLGMSVDKEAPMADDATNNRIEAIRSVLTLEALYEEASNINVTPGWLQRDETAPAKSSSRNTCPRIGAMTCATRRSMRPGDRISRLSQTFSTSTRNGCSSILAINRQTPPPCAADQGGITLRV